MNRLLVRALVIVTVATACMADASGSGFPSFFNVSTLNGRNGFRIAGTGVTDTDGQELATADLNGDGYADIVITQDSANNSMWPPIVYVVFGHGGLFPTSIDVSTLDGTNGFKIIDSKNVSRLGIVITGIGDMNGDGAGDIALGQEFDPRAKVVFGRKQGFPATLDIANLDGNNGFAVTDPSGIGLGLDVAAAGDINGDGLADLAIGGGGYKPSIGIVIFGRRISFPAVLNVATLTAKQGMIVKTPWSVNTDNHYAHLQAAGDINHDGVADLAVSNPGTTTGGRASIIFGKNSGLPKQISTGLLTGSNGYSLVGAATVDGRIGEGIDGIGDVNGDGIADWITFRNNSFVVFGHAPPFGSTTPVASIDGNNGFRMDHLVRPIGIGDVNGDGIADFAGQWNYGVNGQVYGYIEVIYGTKAPTPAVVDAQALDSTAASRIRGLTDSWNKLAAGDVNGDGIPDLVIGDPYTIPRSVTYIVFGRK